MNTSGGSLRDLLPILLLLALPLAAGCEPSCKQTCRKLLDCEAVDTPRQALLDCENSCELQQQVYEDWNDQLTRDAMGDLKECIVDEECSAIADGACYDPDLYIW